MTELASHEELRAGGEGVAQQLGAAPCADGDARYLPAGRTGHQRVLHSQRRLHPLDQGLGRHAGHRPHPPEAACRRRRREAHQVEGRLLVGMRGAKGLHHGFDAAHGKHRLQTDLRHLFQTARFAQHRARALAAEEGPRPGRAEAARRVLADVSGAGREERPSHRLDVRRGEEGQKLQLAVVAIDGAQRPAIGHARRVGQDVVGSALGHVERGVRAEDGDADPRRLEGQRARHEALLRLEEGGMVGDDGLATGGLGLAQDGARAVDGQEDAGDGLLRVTDQEADVVPAGREARRRDVLHRADQVRHPHGHSAGSGFASGAAVPSALMLTSMRIP